MNTKLKVPKQFELLVEDLRKLKKDGNNPNKMSKSQRKALWESLSQFGWAFPIVANLDGLIADGEQKVDVCLEHGEHYGPVLRKDLTDAQRRLLRQTLNKLRGQHDVVLDAFEFERIIAAGKKDVLQTLLSLQEDKLQCILSVTGRDVDIDKLYNNMPEFLQQDQLGRVIKVHFKTDEDVQQFAQLVKQKISDNTKYIWFPEVTPESIAAGFINETVIKSQKEKSAVFDWSAIKTTKKIKPLGSTSPYVWSLEPSYGCNLQCGHCCAELIPEEKKELMTFETWSSAFRIINAVSPTVRVDICGYVGEPTLNPHLTEWLKTARELAPLTQIQITTNGTMLLKGKVKYKELLDAGANVIYTDQYGKHEDYEKLAQESGYPFYQYYNAPKNAWSPWKYYGSHLKMIVLMEEPSTWPQSRFRAGLLGNWYGHLNWEKAKRFGMKPLEKPLTRRCNQPFLYVTVAASGEYLLCCQDGMHISEGMFGNVSEGVEGFHKFWYSKEIQTIRKRLRNKDRASTEFACAKCNVTFSRCDFKHWKDADVNKFWDGTIWSELKT